MEAWLAAIVAVILRAAGLRSAFAEEDPTIYPSDHLGIAAQLEIGEG